MTDRRALMVLASDRLDSVREAQWIIEHVEESIGTAPFSKVAAIAEALITRREAGEPLQYVLGHWSFRSMELVVDQRVLIPRPETEQVAEVAIRAVERDRLGRLDVGKDQPTICVDLGTGSGAIALSLASELLPGGAVEVWAADASAEALEVARINLDRLLDKDEFAGSRVRLTQGSWYESLPMTLVGQVDLVVSNPPYVSLSEFEAIEPEVREWEPTSALTSADGRCGVGGMADIEMIVASAPRWLRPGGSLVVEISPPQAYAAVDAARRAGLTSVVVERDLAGRLRMLVARRPS